MTFEDHGIDLATVRTARAGNAIWPGMAAFTGASFFVYLLVKLAAGTVAADMGTFAQICASLVLMAWGVTVMMRGRFHFITVETDQGTQRIKGLNKPEQRTLMASFAGKTEHDSVHDA